MLFSVGLVLAVQEFLKPNTTGMVVGSGDPWVEVILLHFGARHVFTSEYSRRFTTFPGLQYIHPLDLAKAWIGYKKQAHLL